MTARTIETLSRYISPKEAAGGECLPDAGVLAVLGDGDVARQITHYTYCYSSLKFGWEFAAYMANKCKGKKFPTFLHGDDLYITRAYKFIRSKGKNGDKLMKKVVALTSATFSKARTGIESMLLAKDAGEEVYHEIASAFGMEEEVIRAYEKLFFNVIDRKRESIFIASLVMPEGRLEETNPGYWKETPQEAIFRRVAYERGAGIIKYLLGISEDNPYRALDANMAAGEFNKQLMSSALFYSTLGFYNSPQVEAGRKVIQSALTNDADTLKGNAIAPVADSVRDEVIMHTEITAARMNQEAFNEDAIYKLPKGDKS